MGCPRPPSLYIKIKDKEERIKVDDLINQLKLNRESRVDLPRL